MGYILQQRLPERLQGRFSPFAIELLVGLLAAAIAVGARVPLDPLLGGRAPYVFIFVAVVAAAFLAGWRSGLIALVGGQALTWFVVMEPHWNMIVTGDARRASFLVGTVSEFLVLAVVAIYQREADQLAVEREQRMHLLSQALYEIDHRTNNNYQIVLAMIRLQASGVRGREAKEALERTAERIEALALVSRQLAYKSNDLRTIRLDDHLRELCSQVQRGLSCKGVIVECEAEEVAAPASKAIGIAIIVNELITNSLKHAFGENDEGTIQVKSRLIGSALELVVQDNGSGLRQAAPVGRRATDGGLGSKLIESYVRQFGATHEIDSSPRGTRHRILIPQIADRRPRDPPVLSQAEFAHPRCAVIQPRSGKQVKEEEQHGGYQPGVGDPHRTVEYASGHWCAPALDPD